MAVVTTRVDRNDAVELARLARRDDRSVAALLRIMIRQHIEIARRLEGK
jgi:hypothetical protein